MNIFFSSLKFPYLHKNDNLGHIIAPYPSKKAQKLSPPSSQLRISPRGALARSIRSVLVAAA
jgi:hypothetical protein